MFGKFEMFAAVLLGFLTFCFEIKCLTIKRVFLITKHKNLKKFTFLFFDNFSYINVNDFTIRIYTIHLSYLCIFIHYCMDKVHILIFDNVSSIIVN